MNKLLGLCFLLLAGVASAQVHTAQYGATETFDFRLFSATGTFDVNEDPTSFGQPQISCNEGAQTNTTNDFVDEGDFYSITLTGAELSCERVTVTIIATVNGGFSVYTFGCHLAMDIRGVMRCGTAQSGAAQSITLDAGASAVTDFYRNRTICIVAGTGFGQGCKIGTAYNGTTKVLTVDSVWTTNPDSTTFFHIRDVYIPIIAANANGRVEANVKELDDDAAASQNAELFFDNTGFNATSSIIGQVNSVLSVSGLTTTTIRDAIVDHIIEDAGATYTLDCAIAAILSYSFGEWARSGNVVTYEDPGGNEVRVVATLATDNLSRSSITITCP